MGWALLLVKNFIAWLDGLSEKSILAVLPDLETILLDPRKALAGRESVIGPARKYATALLLGLLLTLTVGTAAIVGLKAVLPARALPREVVTGVSLGLTVFLLALLVGSTLFVQHLFRGGQMTLSERGVELRHRTLMVFCPWALFDTPGRPFTPAPGRAVLPVAPAAVALVEARQGDHPLAQGTWVDTRQWWFRSPEEGVLESLYEVPAEELAKILLFIGRSLGDSQPRAGLAPIGPVPAGAEPARLDEGGWLTVNLTRLVFPPECCDCGAATGGRQKFWASEAFLSPSRLWHPTRADATHVWVPVCYACQTKNQRLLLQAALKGLGAGIGVAFLAGLAMCLWPANLWLALLFLVLLPLGPFAGCMIGYYVGERLTTPVRLRDYSPRKGTVALRFRRPEYGQRLLHEMHTGVAV
jgi:hypothetical protein